MNNKTLLLVAVGVLVAGGVWYSLKGGTSEDVKESGGQATITEEVVVPAPKTAVTSSPGNSSKNFDGTLGGLVTRGGSYKCTFAHTSTVGKTDGTVYVSGNRLRGDFVSTVTGGFKVESHMLYLSGMVYTWTPLAQLGYKAPATPATLGSPIGTSGSQSVNLNQKLNYSCSVWAGDAALFEFPKGIVFSGV